MSKILYFLGISIISVLAIAFIFPIYWTAVGSFENIYAAMNVPPDFFPRKVTFENYMTIFTRHPYARWVLNSLVVATCTVLIGVTCACLSGYAFAKKEFLGKNILFWGLLLTMMIPIHVTIVPLFITFKKLGIHNSYPGVFLPMSCSVSFMFLARQYMSTIPTELIDAARIDGASELKIFSSVVAPICKPLLAALCIFSFIGAWRNFLWPLIMTSSNEARTLPVAIATISAGSGGLVNIGLAMAGATLVALPMYIIFFCFQKYFTKGITLGAVKG